VLPLTIGSLAVLLVVYVLSQDHVPYPYNLRAPYSVTQARQVAFSHSAQAWTHLSLLHLMGNNAPPSLQLHAAKAAVWIEPTNPFVRDFYAMKLLSMGRKDEGLKEIAQSITNSPSFATHFYLKGDFLQRLSKEDRAAVEDGFKHAVALGYRGAVDDLASYYGMLGQFSEQGALYEQAALSENEAAKKTGLLHKAGLAYVKAHDDIQAELVLRKVVTDFPSDPRAYQQLATTIYGPKEDL